MKTCRPRNFATLAGTALTGAALLGLAIGAVAGTDQRGDQRESRFPIVIADAQTRTQERFAELDTDGDGAISGSEFAEARQAHGRQRGWGGKDRRFAGHSADGARDADRAALHAERRAADEDALFALLDQDGDGSLARAEFGRQELRAGKRTLMQKRVFARLDTDDNGVLGPEEFAQPLQRLQTLDANGDGQVTREEARAHHRHRQQPAA